MKDSSLSPWKHSWKHSITNRYGDPSFDIEVVSYKATIYEVVEDFTCYLMGCGYSRSLIVDAFNAQAEEFADLLKDVDKQTDAD
jgi:hypothetical protein